MADGLASPGGGSHESGEHSPRSNVREQDRHLPIANISRIMKKALPANGKIAKDAEDTVQECVSVFISFITNELFDSAKALAFENVPTRDEIKEAIFRTLIRNGMFDNSHIRLSLTRGEKGFFWDGSSIQSLWCTLIGFLGVHWG